MDVIPMAKTYLEMFKDFSQSPISEKGVKIPTEGTQEGDALLYLYNNMGLVVKKKDAEREIFSARGEQSKDLQSLRQLGTQKGFNILQGGHMYQGEKLKRGRYVLLGFENVNNFWSFNRRNDSGLDFDSLKEKYDYMCATCGSKEGKPQRYTERIVVLEKGHMDPGKPMTMDNIIPQCNDCQTFYKDNAIFNERGQVRKWLK